MVGRRCGWWIAGALALAAVAWAAIFVGLLAAAKAVHRDVTPALAAKLVLLDLGPSLIFAGDSRTEYQVDAELAARLIGRPPGSVVNIAVAAGDPVSLLAGLRMHADRLRAVELVVNVSPHLLNEGDRRELYYPMAVVARLTLAEQLFKFLPRRGRTLVRFIIEAFTPRSAGGRATQFPKYGSAQLVGARPLSRLRATPGSDPVYRDWDLSGPKSTHVRAALCAIRRLVGRLVVVVPPWSAIYDVKADDAWRRMEGELVDLLTQTGRGCDFAVAATGTPALTAAHFYDEVHLNAQGVPIYTRHLLERLGHRPAP